MTNAASQTGSNGRRGAADVHASGFPPRAPFHGHDAAPPEANLDRVSAYLRERLADPGQDQPSLQKYLEAYNDLRFLRTHHIDWIGDVDGEPEERLFANIRSLKTDVTEHPHALPPAGMPAFYAHLQQVMAREGLPPRSADAKRVTLRPGETTHRRLVPPRLPGQIPAMSAPFAANAEPPKLPDLPDLLRLDELPSDAASPPPLPRQQPPAAPHVLEDDAAAARPNIAVNGLRPPTQFQSPPPVQREWQRARSLWERTKHHIAPLIVGGATGAVVRIGAQFALAAFVTTTPGTALAIGSAIVIGAVAGGVSRLVTTSRWGGAKKDAPNWKRDAFFKGAAMGALGAGIGAGVAHWLMASNDLHAAQPHARVASPDHAPTPAATPQPYDHEHPQADVAPPHSGVQDILTDEQLKALPRKLRHLASSQNPREIVLFCKEASFELINGTHRDAALGARLIERGLETAKASGIHNILTEKLHADFAYLKAWGIGADKNTNLAIAHARQAGSVMNHYGARLLNRLAL